MLGSDARVGGQAGARRADDRRPARSDSIMLLPHRRRRERKLSIPRDTIVDIPGHGRDKINAAYAIGGSSPSRCATVKEYLGIDINHVIEVDFANFPKLIDSMGGIDVQDPGCVRSEINGGPRNGGKDAAPQRAASTTSPARQALILARTRKNLCNPARGRPLRGPSASSRSSRAIKDSRDLAVWDVRPPAVGLVERAQGGAQRHERALADGASSPPRWPCRAPATTRILIPSGGEDAARRRLRASALDAEEAARPSSEFLKG